MDYKTETDLFNEQENINNKIKKLQTRFNNKEIRDAERFRIIKKDLYKIFSAIKDRDIIKEIDILYKENQKLKEEVLTLNIELKKLRDNITSKIFI